jgi:hypothetical protein
MNAPAICKANPPSHRTSKTTAIISIIPILFTSFRYLNKLYSFYCDESVIVFVKFEASLLPLIDMFRTKKIDLSMGIEDVRIYFSLYHH